MEINIINNTDYVLDAEIAEFGAVIEFGDFKILDLFPYVVDIEIGRLVDQENIKLITMERKDIRMDREDITMDDLTD